MAPSNNINNPRPSGVRGRNTFPQSYKFLTTDCYGLYSPFYWCKAERGDVQPLKTDHDLHTFTMKSPMVGDVSMKKSFVKVPMQAIYPRNWEKMMTIPTQGDDVPADTRAILNIGVLVEYCCYTLNSIATSSTPSTYDILMYLKSFILLENISSNGSLFARFNQHFNHLFNVVDFDSNSYDNISLDDVSDYYFWSLIIDYADRYGASLQLKDSNETFVSLASLDHPEGSTDGGTLYVSPRRFIEILRFNDVSLSDQWEGFLFPIVDISLSSGFTLEVNIEPLISYQLSCAQFATNDFVDYIYSAQLYRDNMQSIFRDVDNLGRPFPEFIYNGVYYQYDVFSKRIFTELIVGDEGFTMSSLDYFLNLTSYVQSLRYGDYFTGAKPRPLAVGEYSAEVVDGSVSAIDITKSIQMQRLLNRVNMIGRKLGDYLAGIFGGSLPQADKDVPIFLAHQYFEIKGFETENTGDRQFADGVPNTITSHLRSTANKHAFEIQVDEPCYLIGMNSYDMMRIYSKTLDRFALHFDRYDDFIPQMQYIGDQDIKRVELDSSSNSEVPFGYCLRYMEYKQRYSYASGGFIDRLPSWAMITDNKDGNPADVFITPDYIRSSPSEFDRFYKSLTGYSLASYFHFIVAHTNITEPIRQMEYTPEILA